MVAPITSSPPFAPSAAQPPDAPAEPVASADFTGPSAQDDSTPGAAGELRGDADGPELQLPSGIHISLRKVGKARVSANELQRVLAGIKLLPAADQALVARSGVRVDLLPVAALEQSISGGDYLGATDLDDDGAGVFRPSGVRVAVRSGVQTGADTPEELVQHELGHVIAVLEHGDRSEAAAIAYAQAH